MPEAPYKEYVAVIPDEDISGMSHIQTAQYIHNRDIYIVYEKPSNNAELPLELMKEIYDLCSSCDDVTRGENVSNT